MELTERDGAIVIGVGVIGLERKGALIALYCLRGTAELAERNAAVVVGIGDARVNRHRFCQQVSCLLRSSCLSCDNCRQV